MKKVLLVCALVIGISAASHAQGGGRRSPEEQVAAWKTSLALTDDQSTKIAAILTTQAKSRDSLMTAANGDRGAMMKGFMKMQPETDTKIKAVLTADQAANYQKTVVEPRNERMKQMMQGGN
jgi:protein CpxP